MECGVNGKRWEDVQNTEILFMSVYQSIGTDEYFVLIPHSCTHTKCETHSSRAFATTFSQRFFYFGDRRTIFSVSVVHLPFGQWMCIVYAVCWMHQFLFSVNFEMCSRQTEEIRMETLSRFVDSFFFAVLHVRLISQRITGQSNTMERVYVCVCVCAHTTYVDFPCILWDSS